MSTRVGAPLRSKVTPLDFEKLRAKGTPITMSTAYSYPSAVHVDSANIDAILVGDSLAMVEIGLDNTLSVDVEQMLYHCKAVSRGASRCLLVGDMPFGSYEECPNVAYRNAIRFLKEGGMDAVKVEGGIERCDVVKKLVDGGVAVMGHIGLTPQKISTLGGFRAQGKTVKGANKLIRDAKALEEAGAFAIVVECVPAQVAKAITRAVSVPTIGIGAGQHTSGQILVYHDLLGMYQHAHHAKVSPKFCKRYSDIGVMIQDALNEYGEDVRTGKFPSVEFSPYKMNKNDLQAFMNNMVEEGYFSKEDHPGMENEEDSLEKELEEEMIADEPIDVY